MRICSFLPSATEVLYALGLGDSLVGVTHECDCPAEARTKPVVVRSRIDASYGAAEVDRQVREFIARGESLYTVDIEALRALAPDLIVMQDLCHVCATSPADVVAAMAALRQPPRVLSLAPRRLSDVWGDVRRIGEAADRPSQGEALAATLDRRVEVVETVVLGAEAHPRVLCLEWLEPLYVAGHWVPEMVEFAGGKNILGRAGEPSFRVEWQDVLAARPEVILVMPCGYSAERAAAEFKATPLAYGWNDLPAVTHGRVYALDANGYFSRPGPRLATGVEILARLFHPESASWPIPAGAVRDLARAASARF
jgi:iron complex transport system substrate-binding protein